MTLEEQIAAVASYIVENVPGEPSRADEGAAECAIRIMREQRAILALLDNHRIALARALALPHDAPWVAVQRQAGTAMQELGRVLMRLQAIELGREPCHCMTCNRDQAQAHMTRGG